MTTTWIVVSLPLSLIAAAVGGLVCALVAPTPAAPRSLALLVLVLGTGMAIQVLTGGNTAPMLRASDVGNLDAMMRARQPVRVALRGTGHDRRHRAGVTHSPPPWPT